MTPDRTKQHFEEAPRGRESDLKKKKKHREIGKIINMAWGGRERRHNKL